MQTRGRSSINTNDDFLEHLPKESADENSHIPATKQNSAICQDIILVTAKRHKHIADLTL